MHFTPLSFLEESLPLPAIRRAVRVHGSILSIDFGEYDYSKNNLAITYCDWILCNQDDVLLDCIETDQSLYDDVLFSLNGKKILNIEKLEKKHVVKITLEDNYYFLLTANLVSYDEDDDLFFLLQENKPAILYSPDKGFVFEKQ